MEIVSDQPEASAQEEAGKRPGDGDIEFLQGAGGIARDAGQAPEDIEGDGLHRNAVVLGDDAVAELVKNHGAEKEDAGDDAEGPVLLWRPCWVLRSELGAQRKSDEQEDDEPAGVQIYRYAENAADLEAAGELAGTGGFGGVGGRVAGVVLVGSGRGGHVVSVWLRWILAEVGRLRGCGVGGVWI